MSDFYDSVDCDEESGVPFAPIVLPEPARIYASGWGVRADRIILEHATIVSRARRYSTGGGGFIETSHDGKGFWKAPERSSAWNDLRGTQARVLLGCTQEDVKALRKALAAIGVAQSFDATEAALCRALRASDEHGTLSQTEAMHLDVREYWKQQRAARVANLRAKGLCIMCGKEKVAPDRSTCSDCGAKANARNKGKPRKRRAA